MRPFAWPTDSRPVVEVPGQVRAAVRQAALEAETKRLDNKRFAAAETWQELCEVGAQWCEGKVLNNPGHPDRDPETIGIADPLAHMNRQGFLTVNSQPGEGRDGQEGHQQKAMVEGWVPAAAVEKLRNLISGTRLKMQVHEGRLPRRNDARNSFDMTRHVHPDGSYHVYSDGGVIPSRKSIGIDYGHEELIDEQRAAFVIIHDPEWGGHDLLWDRLGQPDWDHPTSPAETLMPKYAVNPPPDVKVHLTSGCHLCGSTGPHTHSQDEWQATFDGNGSTTPPSTSTAPPAASGHRSSLWWLDGKDTSKMSFNEVTDLAGRAGDLRDEMQRRGDRPERLAEVEREYQRLLEAQQEAGRRMDERRAARADTTAPPTPPAETAVNNAVAGAIQGVSQVTPTGLVAKALSGVTGKDIKPPMAAAVDPATNSSTPTGGAGMSKTEEGRQLCEQAKELIAKAQGQAQQIGHDIDEAIAALRAAAEGSDQAEVEAAIARLEELKTHADEVLQGCGQMPDLIDAIVW